MNRNVIIIWILRSLLIGSGIGAYVMVKMQPEMANFWAIGGMLVVLNLFGIIYFFNKNFNQKK